jgi:hypothetical protein
MHPFQAESFTRMSLRTPPVGASSPAPSISLPSVPTQVRISSVNSREELNGLTGSIFVVDPSRGRGGVCIDGHGNISLKYTCLAPIAAAEEELIDSLEQLGLYDVKQHKILRAASWSLGLIDGLPWKRHSTQTPTTGSAFVASARPSRSTLMPKAATDSERGGTPYLSHARQPLPLSRQPRWPTCCRWSPKFEEPCCRCCAGASRTAATAHAAHDALRLVRTLALKQLSPANAHVPSRSSARA